MTSRYHPCMCHGRDGLLGSHDAEVRQDDESRGATRGSLFSSPRRTRTARSVSRRGARSLGAPGIVHVAIRARAMRLEDPCRRCRVRRQLGRGPDRPRHEPAAAIGTQPARKARCDAGRAKGALERADAGDGGLRRQVDVAAFAIRAKLKGHGVSPCAPAVEDIMRDCDLPGTDDARTIAANPRLALGPHPPWARHSTAMRPRAS
jgi:hypothetical protein